MQIYTTPQNFLIFSTSQNYFVNLFDSLNLLVQLIVFYGLPLKRHSIKISEISMKSDASHLLQKDILRV